LNVKMSNADAGRIIHIAKRRERAKEDIESQRLKLEKEQKSLSASISTKFTPNIDEVEAKFKSGTVGLVTLDEMKQKQDRLKSHIERRILGFDNEDQMLKSGISTEESTQKRVLSFSFNDFDDNEPTQHFVKKRLGMDPTVDTSFLPDKERDNRIMREREEISKEWHQIQEKEKNEEINIAFCYWDGSSHRKDIKMKKGATLTQFLQRALDILRKEFNELKIATTDQVMFVKEDLIIPHFYTFQDFIKTRQMGKTGPLWQFDSIGEIRVRQDAAQDIGESHPIKVVLRGWYEKNKHIYPASRWEAFVPGKEYRRTMDDLSTI